MIKPDPVKTLEVVRELSHGQGLNFCKLLELHGIAEADHPAYMKRAGSMAHAATQLCQAYMQQVGEKNRPLFVAIATGMAMDAALHSMVTKSESEAIIAADRQALYAQSDSAIQH